MGNGSEQPSKPDHSDHRHIAFSSSDAFRAAFHDLSELAPAQLSSVPKLKIDWVGTPLGPMICAADDAHLFLLEFLERTALPRQMKRLHFQAKGTLGFGRTRITDATQLALSYYFNGVDMGLDVPLAPVGTEFERAAWANLRRIPSGVTRSYSQQATSMGRPDATRAVARANGANPIAIIIPCHRLVGADGHLTGYGGGLWRKERLIKMERKYLHTGDQ